MRIIRLGFVVALAACQPVLPDSGAPVEIPVRPVPGIGAPHMGVPAPEPATDPAMEPATGAQPDEVGADARASADIASEAHSTGSDERAGELDTASVAPPPADAPARPPTLPPAASGDRPSAVAFALATTHSVGTELYRRPLIRLSRVEVNCAAYRTPEEAQEAFLAAGGPERDPLNLDPDGDGFACRWDPAPIRAAARPRD